MHGETIGTTNTRAPPADAVVVRRLSWPQRRATDLEAERVHSEINARGGPGIVAASLVMITRQAVCAWPHLGRIPDRWRAKFYALPLRAPPSRRISPQRGPPPDDAMRAEVRRLWDLGKSGTEIAIATGRSKNQVIGVVHRMGLPARPSPIRRRAT